MKTLTFSFCLISFWFSLFSIILNVRTFRKNKSETKLISADTQTVHSTHIQRRKYTELDENESGTIQILRVSFFSCFDADSLSILLTNGYRMTSHGPFNESYSGKYLIRYRFLICVWLTLFLCIRSCLWIWREELFLRQKLKKKKNTQRNEDRIFT